MSACGTKQTSRDNRLMSAIRSKADIDFEDDALDEVANYCHVVKKSRSANLRFKRIVATKKSPEAGDARGCSEVCCLDVGFWAGRQGCRGMGLPADLAF